MELRELDVLDVVDVAGGAHHQEQHVSVALELRPLVGVLEVLHEQRMQLPRLGELGDIARRWCREHEEREASVGTARSVERIDDAHTLRRAFELARLRVPSEARGRSFGRRRTVFAASAE